MSDCKKAKEVYYISVRGKGIIYGSHIKIRKGSKVDYCRDIFYGVDGVTYFKKGQRFIPWKDMVQNAEGFKKGKRYMIF